MLEIIWIILIGAVTGALAGFFMPGPDPLGLFLTVMLGMVGALIATMRAKEELAASIPAPPFGEAPVSGTMNRQPGRG